MEESSSKSTYSLGQKTAFTLGNFVQWFVNAAFNTWVFSFYFTAKGLNVKYIWLAYIIWTFYNAINDPAIGYLSDRTHTRIGRRKPYIIIGIIPLIIIEIILWIPPVDTQIGLFIFLLLMLLSYDTFYTMQSIPYDALFPELYTSVKERAQVNTLRQIFAEIGLLAAFLVPGFFIIDITQSSGYLTNGIITAITIGICTLVALIWGVKERKEFSHDHHQGFNFFQGLRYSFKNKGFVIYILLFFLYEYVTLILGNIVPFYGQEILGVDTFQTSLLLGVMIIVGTFSMFLWKKLDVLFGSRISYGIAILSYIVGSIPLLLVTNYIAAMITASFMGIGFGGLLYFIYLLIADVIDADELKTGVRREGTFFGIANFFMRLAMILSILSVSIVFTQTGWETYVPNPDVNIKRGIRMLMVIFPAIALLLSLVCLYFYPFTKKKVQEMKTQLTALHEQKLQRTNELRERIK